MSHSDTYSHSGNLNTQASNSKCLHQQNLHSINVTCNKAISSLPKLPLKDDHIPSCISNADLSHHFNQSKDLQKKSLLQKFNKLYRLIVQSADEGTSNVEAFQSLECALENPLVLDRLIEGLRSAKKKIEAKPQKSQVYELKANQGIRSHSTNQYTKRKTHSQSTPHGIIQNRKEAIKKQTDYLRRVIVLGNNLIHTA